MTAMAYRAPQRAAMPFPLGAKARLRRSRSWTVIWVMLVVFGTAFYPFILQDQRNVLVIAVAALALPLIMILRLPIGRDLQWPSAAMLYLVVVMLWNGNTQYFSSVGYTGMFVLSYIAFCGALRVGAVTLEQVRHLLRRLIQAYALVSVVQLLFSLAGLPVPNEILSKGMWSYNSLGVEPSHAARTLGVTLLAYLILSRRDGAPVDIRQLWREEKWTILPFAISIILTGSTLGIAILPLTLLLSLRLRWVAIGATGLWLFWTALQSVETEAVRRLVAFMTALPSMDIAALAEAEHSGAVRVMPLLIFLERASLDDLSVWFGGGYDAVAYYVRGAMIGVSADAAMAGFIPGYIMISGLIGTALFCHAFLGRFLNLQTLPLILLWFLIFGNAAWNSQLFWYGLMLIRMVHHFSRIRTVSPYPVVPSRIPA